MLKTMLESVHPVDLTAYEACLRRFDTVAKPVGSLGELEHLIARIAAIIGSENVNIQNKCVLVFCADNGVVRQGVTQSDHSVTTAIARMLAVGKASVCIMAKTVGADVFPVDIGMVDTVEGLLACKLMAGTNDISQGPAMERVQAEAAIETGIDLVGDKKAKGYRVIATGEAGIGNTATTAAMASVLLDVPAETVTGRGAGLSDGGLTHKRDIVRQAIHINHPNVADPLDVLTKVGGLDIAAMTGAFLGGALHRIPVVMDGVISAVAALTAVRLCPLVKDYILPSHISAEPAGALLTRELGLSPILNAGMRLGEGTGAVALFPLLDMAATVYKHAATFTDIAVDAYTRIP